MTEAVTSAGLLHYFRTASAKAKLGFLQKLLVPKIAEPEQPAIFRETLHFGLSCLFGGKVVVELGSGLVLFPVARSADELRIFPVRARIFEFCPLLL